MSHFNNVNIDEVCRACFEQCDEYKILFEESEMFQKLTLGDVFSQVVKIEIKPGLVNSPTKLCLNCVKDLTAAYNFIKKSQQNNENFLEYIKNGSIKQTDCLSEFPIDIPHDANIIVYPEIKIENELINDYGETFSENKISTSDRYDSTASDYDEPPSNKNKKIHKLECTFCGRTYKRLDFLENHKRKHEEEIKRKEENADDSVSLVCNECGYCCSSNIELQVHLAKEHKESSINPYVNTQIRSHMTNAQHTRVCTANPQISRNFSNRNGLDARLGYSLSSVSAGEHSGTIRDASGRIKQKGNCFMCEKRRPTRKACEKCTKPVCDQHSTKHTICNQCI